MPTTQSFDRINDINTPKMTVMSIEKYFGEMKLSQAQKKERIALANDLEDVMMVFFSLLLLINEFGYMSAISAVDAKKQLSDRVYETVGKHTKITDEMKEFLDQFIDDVNDTTTEHLAILAALTAIDEPDNQTQEKEKFEEHYVSEDRARLLAEEESNTLFNLADFEKAKRLGYKYKTWVTMRDNKVRHTHAMVDDATIPIDEFFVVGNTLLRFPRDVEIGNMREIAGCRCSVVYSK